MADAMIAAQLREPYYILAPSVKVHRHSTMQHSPVTTSFTEEHLASFFLLVGGYWVRVPTH